MTVQIHDPHDRLFGYFLSDITKAKDFLETYLPDTIKQHCDFSSLQFKPGSFVEKDLKHPFSDILYAVKCAGTQSYIYTLIEHETMPHKLTAFTLLRYQLAIMKQHLDQGHKTLPVVIPLLFYRGKKSPYPFSTHIFDCFENKVLAEEIFLKPYSLIDITVIPDDELRQHKSIAMLELVQKNIHRRDALEFIDDIALPLVKNLLTDEQFQVILYYISHEGESKDFERFYTNLAESLPNEYREDIMTLAQQLQQKGRQEGREAGLQEGMQKGRDEGRHQAVLLVAKRLLLEEKMSAEAVQRLTGLSAREVMQLATKIIEQLGSSINRKFYKLFA